MDCMLVVHVSDSEQCPPSQVLIHSLLSMFHPRPFIKSRFAPQGAVACIQASSDFYFHIAFRSETIWLDLFWKVPPKNKRRHFNFVYKCTIFCISKIQIEFPFKKISQTFIVVIVVVLRIHAEFQLNDVPDFPFWFTPGQFTGHIIMSRDASHIRDFRLYVPNNRCGE